VVNFRLTVISGEVRRSKLVSFNMCIAMMREFYAHTIPSKVDLTVV
jgi:hypothetical protein